VARDLERDREADYASSDDNCVVAGFRHSGFGHRSRRNYVAAVDSSRAMTNHRLRMQITDADYRWMIPGT
jgi:hypothetical protein